MPVTRRLIGASGLAPIRGSSLAVSGASILWNDATFARTHPARSVTRARAGPASDRSPVAWPTSSSAWAVSSSKSGWSEA